MEPNRTVRKSQNGNTGPEEKMEKESVQTDPASCTLKQGVICLNSKICMHSGCYEFEFEHGSKVGLIPL
jgi:hypothetical protein